VSGIQAIRITRTGGPEVLDVATIDLPPPGPGEIRIRHSAVGVNFIDTYHRTGLYPIPIPGGLGLEAAGIVEAIGNGVTDFSIGDRAAYCTGPIGAYAEAANVPAARCVPIPDGVADDVAAAALLKGLTAEFLIRRTFTVKPGQTVLLHAAAGGVGLIALQWLKHLGATVIGTVGSSDKADLVRRYGCDHVIQYRDEPVTETVRKITGGAGVPVVYDSVGKDTLWASLDSLAIRGLFVSYGNASGPPDPVSPLELSKRGSLFMTRPTLFHYVGTTPELRDAARDLFQLIANGTIQIEVGARFGLSQAADAHRALEARATTGSTVLEPGR
jgi:NADPH:quinone reductase